MGSEPDRSSRHTADRCREFSNRALAVGALLLAFGCDRPVVPEPLEVVVEEGITPDGMPTSSWIAAIADRNDNASLASIRDARRPWTATERAWLERIRARIRSWRWRAIDLALPFPGLRPPRRITVLLGNAGGDDGFTHGGDTIALDLSSWARAYREPTSPDDDRRIDRILSHEHTHLLMRAWERTHPMALETPLDRALGQCFHEGFGNYRSLGPRWIDPRGSPLPRAREAERRLAPIFVDRLVRLATATRAEEDALREGMSSGPFDRKWGAVPVALWLAREARGSDRRLRPWVALGPRGILVLARKHLPRRLARRLDRL